MIRALLVDDHEIFLNGLRAVLSHVAGLTVIATATTVMEGKQICKALSPDVIVLDVRLPDSRGAIEVQSFKKVCPGAKVVVLTGYGIAARPDALKSGADDFLTKDMSASQIADRIVGLFELSKAPGNPLDRLSERERQVASLVATGLTNVEAAATLGISVNTVKTHLTRIQSKLGVRDRLDLAFFWRDASGA